MSNIFLVCFLGFCVGIILSILVQHYPLALKTSWTQQCEAYLQNTNSSASSPIYLLWRNLRAEYNASALKRTLFSRKSIFYGVVLAVFTYSNAYEFGYSFPAFGNFLLVCGLLLLAGIDWQHLLLPDSITLLLLWTGLFCNVWSCYIPVQHAILGAATGYLSLRGINILFYWLTGKHGLGLGDCKLFAVFGAWWGYAVLPYIMLIASVAALLIVGCRVVLKLQKRQACFSFGPYLVSAGILCLFCKGYIAR